MQTEFYKKYMRSREWEDKRQERLEIDNRKCVMCDRPASKCKDGLQVHHVHYKDLGHEDVYNSLVCLCPRCHESIHKMMCRVTSPDGRRGWADLPYTAQKGAGV